MLFEDIAKAHLSGERIRKYEAWFKNADKAKESRSLGPKDNQCDKTEELITFYTFAPLELREDKIQVIQEILGFCGIDESTEDLSSW
jgi:hypothetical protein